EAPFLRRPMGRDRLRETVQGPVRAAGAEFESDAMVDRLVGDGGDSAGGLPLLQFTLAEMWDLRDAATQRIPADAIHRLGGVAGALARHADDVIARMLPEQRASARRVLVQLVTPEGTRNRASAAELTREQTDAHACAALEALVQGRLVVAHENERGTTEY